MTTAEEFYREIGRGYYSGQFKNKNQPYIFIEEGYGYNKSYYIFCREDSFRVGRRILEVDDLTDKPLRVEYYFTSIWGKITSPEYALQEFKKLTIGL